LIIIFVSIHSLFIFWFIAESIIRCLPSYHLNT
jgi:hypothetical protein